MADLLFIMGIFLFLFGFHTIALFSDVHFKLFGDMNTLINALSVW